MPNEAVKATPYCQHFSASTLCIWNTWECFRGAHMIVLWWLCLGQLKYLHRSCLWFCVCIPLLKLCFWGEKKSCLWRLEACLFPMTTIWDQKAMWWIGLHWFWGGGAGIKSTPCPEIRSLNLSWKILSNTSQKLTSRVSFLLREKQKNKLNIKKFVRKHLD